MSVENEKRNARTAATSRGLDAAEGAVQASGARPIGSAPYGAVLQRKDARDGSDGSAASAHAEASRGVSGGGGGVPYQAEMEQHFGTSFAGVSAHTGVQAKEACSSLGAQAYTSGESIAFRDGAPSRSLVAHELTHVVQQRGGVQLKDGMGQSGDSYERQADAVASRVSSGGSAGIDTGAGKSAGSGGGVQFFKDYPRAGLTDKKKQTHWAANTYQLRVAEDGTVAVGQRSLAGSQEAYVLSSRIAGANADLKSAGSPIALKENSGGTVKGAPPVKPDGSMNTLAQVVPVRAANPKSTNKLEIPNDCGGAAHEVTGAAAAGKRLHAEFEGKDGKTKNATESDPELQKYQIMLEHFGPQIANAKTILADVKAQMAIVTETSKKLKPYNDKIEKVISAFNKAYGAYEPAKSALLAAKDADEATKKALHTKFQETLKAYIAAKQALDNLFAEKIGSEKLGDILKKLWAAAAAKRKMVAALMAPYDAQADKEAFDKKVGINRHADPDVGKAYTISSGGDPKKKADGSNIMTWNFHWGGVILKSTTGSDNITLENYAGSADSAWKIQVYGVPTKDDARTGQTFHEQHRDKHKQHGETPTTLSTEK